MAINCRMEQLLVVVKLGQGNRMSDRLWRKIICIWMVLVMGIKMAINLRNNYQIEKLTTNQPSLQPLKSIPQQ